MKEFYFLKDSTGYFMDEIPGSKVGEYLAQGRFVEIILATHRWEADKIAKKRNCELSHLITGEHCTCGEHNF